MADWQALIALSADAVAQDEQRAEIAILLSVAFNQLGEGQQGRYWAEQAKAWGADKQFMKRALLSGAMNSVANVALLDAKQVGLTPKSLRWLEQSAKVSLGDSAVPALVKARAENQLRHLQLSIEQRLAETALIAPQLQVNAQQAWLYRLAIPQHYQFDEDLRLWHLTATDAFTYSDGEVEAHLLAVLKSASDVSLYSPSLIVHQRD